VPQHLYQPIEIEDRFQIFDYKPTLEEVTYLHQKAMVALRDGFPGTALKLGKDLWVYREFQDFLMSY
jgi:hypothetical protein